MVKFRSFLHEIRMGTSSPVGSIHIQTTELGLETQKMKPKLLCLHGFRTSGEILKKQIGRWPEIVLDRLTLDFLDGPHLATAKSGLERVYTPPYYQWYHSNQDFSEYYHFEECVAYIEDYMIKHGPFDGLLGFSQGGMLSAALLGMQIQGMALTKVQKINFVIIISGSKFAGLKFGQPKLAASAFSSPLICPSMHIIGEKDYFRERSNELLESFEDPFVIRHSEGHTVPRLEGKSLETMLDFIEKIEKLLLHENRISASL